jgi:aminomethyltransferase
VIDQSPSQHAPNTQEVGQVALSPLDSFHRLAKAKMADFGGWMMPIEYPAPSGVLAEHHAVRSAVGLFDVSHLGKISITGEGAAEFLNKVVTSDISKVKPGQAQYSLLCNDDGSVIDDLIVYLISDQELFLVPNAANCQRVSEVIALLAPEHITVTNLHHRYGVIALQGPRSREVLSALSIRSDIDYMGFLQIEIAGEEVIICRSGYSGELGFELIAKCTENSAEFFLRLWSDLVAKVNDEGGLVAGLGARDTLRTEMGYPLHGQELSDEINPIEAGAKWAVAFDKEEFLGKSALVSYLKEPNQRKSFAIKALDRGIPRRGMAILKNGEIIGHVTSGTFSPSLKVGIGLALLNIGSEKFSIGDQLEIDLRGRRSAIEIVKLPFLPSQVRS